LAYTTEDGLLAVFSMKYLMLY